MKKSSSGEKTQKKSSIDQATDSKQGKSNTGVIEKIKIGSVEFELAEIQWPRKPKEPEWQNPFARKDCDCDECSAIIKHDAWLFHNDSGITGDRLIHVVSKQNGWIEDGPYIPKKENNEKNKNKRSIESQ